MTLTFCSELGCSCFFMVERILDIRLKLLKTWKANLKGFPDLTITMPSGCHACGTPMCTIPCLRGFLCHWHTHAQNILCAWLSHAQICALIRTLHKYAPRMLSSSPVTIHRMVPNSRVFFFSASCKRR